MGLERFDLAAIEARVLDAPPGGLRDDALALITEVRRLRRVVESGAAEPVRPLALGTAGLVGSRPPGAAAWRGQPSAATACPNSAEPAGVRW
jgi:hypothetical protein